METISAYPGQGTNASARGASGMFFASQSRNGKEIIADRAGPFGGMVDPILGTPSSGACPCSMTGGSSVSPSPKASQKASPKAATHQRQWQKAENEGRRSPRTFKSDETLLPGSYNSLPSTCARLATGPGRFSSAPNSYGFENPRASVPYVPTATHRSGQGDSKEQAFLDLNDFLLRGHAKSLIVSLAMDGWIEQEECERLKVRLSDKSPMVARSFLAAYTRFSDSRDVQEFASLLRRTL